jgi:nucleoside-diphosphate-sugar epimerase
VTDRTVGIIGLGIMGGAIARNLVERGWAVVGFDTEPSRRSELGLAGVTIVDSASAVASHATMIMTSLPNADAAHAVATEIAGCGQPARIVIELSTFTIADKVRFKSILEPALRSTVRSAEPAPRPRFETWSSTRAATKPRSCSVLTCLPTLPSRAPISEITAMAAG